jgi:2-dehydro-3-deoxyphosphogluconate aldolase / (4S)-4-hydroxy-2-oxoglutarate aldolase
MARFDRLTVYQTLIEESLLPLFYHAEVGVTQTVAAALQAGGSHLMEYTNRGDGAINVFTELIAWCKKNTPDMIIGVGTVEDAATAAMYIAQGANFVVSPIFTEEVARLCNRRKIPYMPGCMTLTEIAHAEEYGAEIVKLFPSDGINGVEFVKAALAPRPWTRIMPTGGVSAEEGNLRKWFGAGVTAVGIGGNLIKPDWVKNGDSVAISANIRETLAIIRTIKAK